MQGIKLGFAFVALPVSIVDESLDLSLNEYRLLVYLIRHQLKLGKNIIAISQDELLRGRRKHDGTRYDRGCLISCSRDLVKAREQLESRGWLRFSEDSGVWNYEIILADSDQVQNAPSQMQNAPKAGAKCTRNRVQNALAINIKVLDPSKEPSQEDSGDEQPALLELDKHSAGKSLGMLIGMNHSGWNLHTLVGAIEQGKRRWPELRNEQIAEKIAALWKEYTSQATHVKHSLKNWLDTVGRFIDSDDWRVKKKSEFKPEIDWQGGYIGEDGVYVTKNGSRLPGFRCPPKPRDWEDRQREA